MRRGRQGAPLRPFLALALLLVAPVQASEPWTTARPPTIFAAVVPLDGELLALGSHGTLAVSSDDGLSWAYEQADLPAGHGFFSSFAHAPTVATNGDTIVARVTVEDVSSYTAVSADGRSWVPLDQPRFMQTVLWDGARYVAVGVDDDGRGVFHSADGTTWKRVGNGIGSQLVSFTVADGTYWISAAKQSDQEIWRSTDGATFERVGTIDGISQQWHALAGNGEHLVAIGRSAAFVSTDRGHTWTEHDLGGTGFSWYSARWDGQQFIAVGLRRTDRAFVDDSYLATSPDGMAWTLRNLRDHGCCPPYVFPGAFRLAHHNDRYILHGGYNFLATSPDLTTWHVVPDHNYEIAALLHDGEEFLILGFAGIEASPDLQTWRGLLEWTDTPRGFPRGGLAYNGHRYVAGWTGLWTSTDKDTWTEIIPDVRVIRARWLEDRFIVLLSDGTVLTSIDGRVWETITSLARDDLPFWDVARVGDRYVFAGSAQVVTTTDLRTIEQTVRDTGTWVSAALDPQTGTIVLASAGWYLLRSPDGGVTWDLLTDHPGTGLAFDDVFWNGTTFTLASGKAGLTLTSTDGHTWTEDGHFTPAFSAVTGLAVGSTRYLGSESATVWRSNGYPTCPAHAVCVHDDRFVIEVEWQDFDGNHGSGTPVPHRTADSGLFTFFGPDNWELLVKVLDACTFNDHYWVFAAATTNVAYTLRVTDTHTGAVRTYANPLGQPAAALADTTAFTTCTTSKATQPDAADASDTLLLHDGRYRATLTWTDFSGTTGTGHTAVHSNDSGIFWFFGPNNWELLVKILDACTFNDHYWVFAAATTNVAYALTIHDTATGVTRTYTNPLGTRARAVTDTTAFPTCGP